MLQALLPLIPGAIKLGADIINRPQEEDFAPNTQYLERYVNNLKGANRGTGERVTRPLFNKVREQNRATSRKVNEAVGRGDLSSTEQAQLNISQGQAANQALQRVGEKSADIQTQVNVDTGRQVNQILSQIEGIKEQARLNFRQAQKNYNKQIGADLLGLGATAVAGGLQRSAQTKSAYEQAKAGGLIGDISLEDYKAGAKGFSDMGQYNQMLQQRDDLKSTILSQFPNTTEDEISGITSRSSATAFMKAKEQEQGKVYRSMFKGDLTEDDINNASILNEQQKNALYTKMLGGDPKTLSPETQGILVLSRQDVPQEDFDNAVVEAFSNPNLSSSEANLIASAERARNTRIDRALKAEAKDTYESGDAGKVVGGVMKGRLIFSKLDRLNKAFGDGQLPAVLKDKLNSAYYESISPQTTEDLFNAVDKVANSLRLPEGKDAASAFMASIATYAAQEGIELRGKDPKDKLESFRSLYSEKYKNAITDMAKSSLTLTNEDVLAKIQPEPVIQEEQPAPQEAEQVPGFGGSFVEKPQAFIISENDKDRIAESLPNGQAFRKYVDLNPNIRIILDEAAKMPIEKLTTVSAGDLREIKTQLFELGLIKKVYGPITAEDFQALQSINQFNRAIPQNSAVLD